MKKEQGFTKIEVKVILNNKVDYKSQTHIDTQDELDFFGAQDDEFTGFFENS